MKQTMSLLLALVLCLPLCACGGGNDTPETTEAPTETTAPEAVKLTKEELLNIAEPLMKDEAEKIFQNAAYANTLISNTYTFTGKVYEIQVDYVDIALTGILDEAGQKYAYDYWNLSFHLYLPVDELVNVNYNDTISFVGQISEVKTKKTDDGSGFEIPGTIIIMNDAYIVE